MFAKITAIIGLGLGLGAHACAAKQVTTKPAEKWQPKVGDSWQIVLYGAIDLSDPAALEPDVDIYDLDLYENDAEVFSQLHSMGKKVICYFSGGSYEDWRPDAADFSSGDLGTPLEGWEGENWIDLNSENVRRIMAKRIELAAEKGCDAIDPDNVDGYGNTNGLGLTEEDTVSFVTFLSEEAARYNMATGLKNAGAVANDVLGVVDFSVNEQCDEYDECSTYSTFIENAKPVFHIEYPKGTPLSIQDSVAKAICGSNGSEGFSTVMKTMDLDGWVQYCDGSTYKTEQ